MERTLVYADESGNPNLETTTPGVSSHYVIVAVVLRQSGLEQAETLVRDVRNQEFQGAEIKSSSVGPNHARRLRILSRFVDAPWKYIVFVADKSEIFKDSGLRFKRSFIKHLNGKVYSKIFRAYKPVSVHADQHGRSEFMESVKRYVEARCMPDLFEGSNFSFVDSKEIELVQVADFIAGSLAKVYGSIGTPEATELLAQIRPMVLSYDEWPLSMQGPSESMIEVSEDRIDLSVRVYCRQLVETYQSTFNDEADDDCRLRNAVLGLLLDEVRYGDPERYISSAEIKERLPELGFDDVSANKLQTGIIAHFRDNGVIIGSSNHGYKIPTQLSDIHSYVEHCQNVIAPMKTRLHDARTSILTNSHGDLDIVGEQRFAFLKEMLDKLSALGSVDGESA